MLEEIRDSGEGDARGRGGLGEEHPAGHDGCKAVFVIERVHSGGETAAAGFGFEAGEKAERVQLVGHEIAEPDADVEGLLIHGALRAERPELCEGLDECLTVLTFDDGDALGPCGLPGCAVLCGFGSEEFEKERHVGGPEPSSAEAESGLVQKLMGDGAGAFDSAEAGRENVAVADRFGVFEDGVVEVFATEPVPEPFAVDAAPGAVHLFAIEGKQLRHGADVVLMEAALHARADSWEVAELKLAERGGEDVWCESNEAVGFVHVGGDFGEVAVGREADGAAKSIAGVVPDGLLDAAGKVEGVQQGLFAAHQGDGHFINRHHG